MLSENQEVIFKRFDEEKVQEVGKSSKRIRIIHFNDVYNIECSKQEPTGGAARFTSVLNTLNAKNDCLVVFSGDAFSPSTRMNIKL